MFVGYALSHEGNVYIILDLATRVAHIPQDITWLRRIFFENNSSSENHTSRNLLINEVGEIEGTSNNRTSTSEQVENENKFKRAVMKIPAEMKMLFKMTVMKLLVKLKIILKMAVMKILIIQ